MFDKNAKKCAYHLLYDKIGRDILILVFYIQSYNVFFANVFFNYPVLFHDLRRFMLKITFVKSIKIRKKPILFRFKLIEYVDVWYTPSIAASMLFYEKFPEIRFKFKAT